MTSNVISLEKVRVIKYIGEVFTSKKYTMSIKEMNSRLFLLDCMLIEAEDEAIYMQELSSMTEESTCDEPYCFCDKCSE